MPMLLSVCSSNERYTWDQDWDPTGEVEQCVLSRTLGPHSLVVPQASMQHCVAIGVGSGVERAVGAALGTGVG